MKIPFETITHQVNETEEAGALLAKLVVNKDSPKFVAMYGDLGVGKTAFVRGFCSEICPGVNVKSPTFALVNEYKCSPKLGTIRKVCHFDMYRVADEDDLYSIGFYDYLRDDIICIAEWCELIPYAIPEEYVRVCISKTDSEDKRLISINIVN